MPPLRYVCTETGWYEIVVFLDSGPGFDSFFKETPVGEVYEHTNCTVHKLCGRSRCKTCRLL